MFLFQPFKLGFLCHELSVTVMSNSQLFLQGEKEVVITVDWNKIEDWSVVHAVGGESPTERWLRKCLEQIADIADQHENMVRQKTESFSVKYSNYSDSLLTK